MRSLVEQEQEQEQDQKALKIRLEKIGAKIGQKQAQNFTFAGDKFGPVFSPPTVSWAQSLRDFLNEHFQKILTTV